MVKDSERQCGGRLLQKPANSGILCTHLVLLALLQCETGPFKGKHTTVNHFTHFDRAFHALCPICLDRILRVACGTALVHLLHSEQQTSIMRRVRPTSNFCRDVTSATSSHAIVHPISPPSAFMPGYQFKRRPRTERFGGACVRCRDLFWEQWRQ